MFVIANILQPLIDVNEAILRFWHDNVGLGWGFSIIMLTVVVRLAILPLTFKQVRSMQALQQLQPEMKKLQERYKDDKQRLNQEMMKFYSENKVNPLSSCLPLILQFPFFLSLYYLQQTDEFKNEVSPEGFFFIPDLTKSVTDNIPVLITLLVIYVGTQLISSMVTAVNASDPTQKKIMYALPFFFAPVIITFPAGLILYWITTNVWTIGQQLAVRKFLPMPDLPGKGKDAEGANGGGKAAGKIKAGSTDGKGSTKGSAKGSTKAVAKGAKSGSNGSSDGARERKPPPPSPRKKKKNRRR